MAASITDLLRRGAPAFSTTLSAQKGAGAASASLSSSTGIPTTTAIEICVGRVDANGTKTPALKAIYKGLLSGTTVSSLTLIEGTDQLHAAGTPVEIIFSAAQWNNLIDWATAQHDQQGGHGAITATSLVTTGAITENGIPLASERAETYFDHVASGCVITGTGYGSTLAWSMTSGVVYIGGKRLTVASASGTVTASKDTYFDLLDPGSGSVATLVNTGGNIVANNAASPALAASSVRIGIVVSGANIAAATSINQGQETMVLPIASSVPYTVTDSLGNLICPRDPNRRVLGYRQILTSFAGAGNTNPQQVTGLSCPVIVPTGRKVKISFYSEAIFSSTGTATVSTSVWDGVVNSGTQINQASMATGAAGFAYFLYVEAMTTPSTASKTYNAGIKTSNAANVANVDVGATFPAYIKVELV